MEDAKVLSASDIVGKEDFEYKDIEVAEWGGIVRLRVMTAAEAIQFTEDMKGQSRKNAMLKIVALCAVDATGKRMFTDDKVQTLGQKNLKVLMRLQREAIELNGLKPDKNEEAALLKEAKND